MKPVKLFLHEQILLLALRDKEGTIACGSWYSYAIGGAVLAELMLTGRIKVDQDGKKQFARLVNKRSTGNKVIDECIDKLANAKRREVLSTWVSRFANLSRLKDRVAIELCDKKVLKADEKTVLWIFTRKIYPELDPKPERELMERMRKAIFTNTREVDPETSVLIALADATQILPAIFDKQKLKTRKHRIEQIGQGKLVGKAAKAAIDAVQAAQTAIMVAAIMPAIMSTTISH